MIFAVLISSLSIISFADDQVVYQTIAPINFNNYGGDVTAVAFPGPHTENLYRKVSGVLENEKTYLNNTDYYNEQNTHLLTKTIDGNEVTYIKINLICNYSSVYINGVVYYGSTASSPASMNLFNAYEFISSPVAHSYEAGVEYRYYFDVILTNSDAVEQAYQQGFDAGRLEGYDQGFNAGLEENGSLAYANGYTAGYIDGESAGTQLGYNEGYDTGYNVGLNASGSANLGQNLLGDTLNAPMNALNQFVLYDPDGTGSMPPLTLGLVVGGVITLTLFIAFLKIFAGG